MKQIRDYQCLECGKLLTLAQAEKALNGDRGCPKCGGCDIDLYVPPQKPENAKEQYAQNVLQS